MGIETITDLNTVLSGCGCCPQPTFVEPFFDRECKAGGYGCFHTSILTPPGWASEPTGFESVGINTAYEVKTETLIRTRDDTGATYQQDIERKYTFDENTLSCTPSTVTTTTGSGFSIPPSATLTGTVTSVSGAPGDATVEISVTKTYFRASTGVTYTQTDKVTYSSFVPVETRIERGLLLLAEQDWGACAGGVEHGAFFDGGPILTLYLVRFRFDILPYAGKYALFTYDILDQPYGWDHDPPLDNRSWYAEDQTVVWTGPGDELDPETWLTDWVELPVPTDETELRVVNIRYILYRSASTGVAPITMAEAIADDEL